MLWFVYCFIDVSFISDTKKHTFLWEPMKDFQINNAVQICIQCIDTSACKLVSCHNGIASIVNPVYGHLQTSKQHYWS